MEKEKADEWSSTEQMLIPQESISMASSHVLF